MLPVDVRGELRDVLRVYTASFPGFDTATYRYVLLRVRAVVWGPRHISAVTITISNSTDQYLPY